MKFVDLKKYHFALEPRYYFYGWSKSKKILGRPSAVRALARARDFLPSGYNFKIWDGQRPLKVQLNMLASFRRRLQLLQPNLRGSKLNKILFSFGARPLPRVKQLGSHRLGGSFDLTIIDREGLELYFGTDHDDLSDKAAMDYFEKKKKLTFLEQKAKENRRLLKRVMTGAGFKNYPLEWWHWSFEK